MIFVPSVRVGEELQAALSTLGVAVPFYHSRAGTAWERQELAKRFLGQSEPAVRQIVCTNAFGMGLDLPNVRLTIHWQQPASLEDLLQEYGRGRRDGKGSAAVVFHDTGAGNRDVSRLRFMAEQTVDASRLAPTEREELLLRRFAQIADVARVLQSRTCFRTLVTDYFTGGPSKARLRLSEWVINWMFGARESKVGFSACCDACDARQIERSGRLAYIAATIAS